jgi:hypothetical protein
MNTNDPQKLEAAVHRVLRGLPERKAPAGLEGRVLAELARRAALPWWRKSFAHWPAAIRAGFFAGSVLAAALVVSGLIYLSKSSGAHELSSGIASSVGWLVLVRDVAASANDKIGMVIAAIPPLWLYVAVGTIAISYASLAAIGAATYRTLSFGRATP